jgi:hypothetical protein
MIFDPLACQDRCSSGSTKILLVEDASRETCYYNVAVAFSAILPAKAVPASAGRLRTMSSHQAKAKNPTRHEQDTGNSAYVGPT